MSRNRQILALYLVVGLILMLAGYARGDQSLAMVGVIFIVLGVATQVNRPHGSNTGFDEQRFFESGISTINWEKEKEDTTSGKTDKPEGDAGTDDKASDETSPDTAERPQDDGQSGHTEG